VVSKVAAEWGLDAGGYARAKTGAARLAPLGHRAEADARNLPVLWNIVAEVTLTPRWQPARLADRANGRNLLWDLCATRKPTRSLGLARHYESIGNLAPATVY